jgi:hypothetical protein
MNRRRFLEGFMGLVGLPPGFTARGFAQSAATKTIRITVDTQRRLAPIPDDFTGLGYETSSVATPGLLSDKNDVYVQLVRGLGASGVIRIGGIVSDNASFSPDAPVSSAAKATVINTESLRDLAGFLDATDWRLIWGLNLGSGDAQSAADEAVAVAAIVKDKLLAFEIGNEPDGFAGDVFSAHRPKTYGYDDFLKEYRTYKAAVRSKLPDAPFAGPDASYRTDWVTRFAADEGGDLKFLTRHYYRSGANNPYLDKLIGSGPNISAEQRASYEDRRKNNKTEMLLRADPNVRSFLQEISVASRVPLRVCETNSFYGGGQPGVSDAFASALWVLDFMWVLAAGGAAGVNMETGVNQLDFVSYYSPIPNDANGNVSVAPEYYGMLAFAQGSQGDCVAIDYDAGAVNLTAYAAVDDQDRLAVTLINKDRTAGADVAIASDRPLQQATALRLEGRAPDSADDVTLGGSAVMADGRWRPADVEILKIAGGVCNVHVPAASAAVVRSTS